MIGIARTGSGKTLGFILPALVAILEEKRYYKKKEKVIRIQVHKLTKRLEVR